ncbi:T9SS type A sorting domain-containing protein [Flavobacterium litorale]|uniref:T9SS type A sorting domain-containing protein n=1 Tax=Flavobacterium litorale TaxID=2856519 RepID=A0ABX8V9C6_9FLAO|nr:T9SS type A sorting domain-containing protein [Flavobacterium litorale]QYJ67420.1 T9SS type A sorting domain-containing protein [Flavobacterium litorale]
MRKYIKQIILYNLLLVTSAISAQEQTRLCAIGSFEIGLTPQFNFTEKSNLSTTTCNYDVSTDTDIPIASITGVNNFSDKVTIVDNDATISGGNDPDLFAQQPSVAVPRVADGAKAIKLNDNTTGLGDKSVTSMNFAFEVTNPVISFKYSLVATNPIGLPNNELPRFIVNLVDGANGNSIDGFCLTVDPNDSELQSTGTTSNDLLYSGWQCVTFEIDTTTATYPQGVNLQFIVIDDAKGLGFNSVYIDSICDGPCCPDCPDITLPVGTGMIDEQEAEICIYASNAITGTGSAIYHAGTEVVLETGFEALEGTKDRFYIEGCTGSFALRPGNSNNLGNETDTTPQILDDAESGFKVYPNPTQNQLTITISNDVAPSKVSLYSVDGKLILQTKPSSTNNNYTIDIGSISKGIYILSVETTDGNITSTKVVKN